MIQLKLPSFFFPFSFWFVIIIYLILLLIGPKVSETDQKKYCVRNFEINSFFGHSMNCDSADFMKNAAEPKKLLEEKSIRSARPGIIWVAHYVSIPINKIAQTLGIKFGKGSKINEKIIHPKIIYISFILINFILLISSIYFYFKIFNNSIFNVNHYKIWYLWFAQFIVINEITHQFFWSPHTPILNIFNAVISIYFSIQIINQEKSKLPFYSLFLGFFLLSYASFLISFFFIITIYLFNNFLLNNKIILKKLLNILLSTFLFFLPYFIWYQYVVSINGSFYFQNLTEYPLLLWIGEYLTESGFLQTIITIFSSFLSFNYSFFKLHILLSFYFIIITFITLQNKNTKISKTIYLLSILYIIFYSMFYTLLGTGAHPRITTALLIPVLVILSQFFRDNEIPSVQLRPVQYVSFFALIFYTIYFANKFGNYT